MTRPTLHHDPDAERAFIGSLLRLVNDSEFDAAYDAAFSLEPDNIHSDELRLVVAAFRRLLQRGESFDHQLLVSELKGSVENPAYILLEAGESVASAIYIEGYANVIRKAAAQRRAVCILNDGLNEVGKTTDATAVITKLRAALDKIVPPTITQPTITTDPYVSFPTSVLPTAVGDYVRAASCAIGCDASFIALPLFGSLARAIGNKYVIRLKRTWTEPAIIWAANVGKSGTHKTPAMTAATKFLHRKQEESIHQYADALIKFEQDKAIYDRDYAAWKRSKKRGPPEPPPWEPQAPLCERFVTTDCTIEALASLLAGQFDGVLVGRDELAGWLGGIAEYKGGKGSDLGHWLASWSAAPLTVDRKTGAIKMLHVPRAAVSIIGGIQPQVLRKAIGQEHMQDGLCARLLLAMPDVKPVRWTDAIVDPQTEATMTAIFDRLLAMESAADGETGKSIPFEMSLSPEAKAAWIEYYDRHRAELIDMDDDLAAAWSKLEAYAARFALIFQLCSWAAGEADNQGINEIAMRSGITLADWFGGEAKRVYGLFVESQADRKTRELLELIRRRGGRITARDLMHASKRYQPTDVAEDALAELVKAGYGRWAVVPTAGRPRCEFTLSPVSPQPEAHEIRESETCGYGDGGDVLRNGDQP